MELKRELQGREPPNHCDHCDPAVCYRAYGVRQLPLCSINLAAERRHRHRQCRGPAPILCGSNPETHSTHIHPPPLPSRGLPTCPRLGAGRSVGAGVAGLFSACECRGRPRNTPPRAVAPCRRHWDGRSPPRPLPGMVASRRNGFPGTASSSSRQRDPSRPTQQASRWVCISHLRCALPPFSPHPSWGLLSECGIRADSTNRTPPTTRMPL
jgi:hypothetical protein